MARGDWGLTGKCSYKRATLILCAFDLLLALYVLHSLYASLYIYPLTDTHSTFKYTLDQIKKMEESNRIRKAAEPTELIQIVIQLENKVMREERVELPKHLRQKLIDEIRDRLRSLDGNDNATEQNVAIGAWRKEKLEEVRKVSNGETSNSTILAEEAGIIERALSSAWIEFKEDIGLWIPTPIINREHDYKPAEEEEFGRQLPVECHAELHTDYGGAALRWGLTHHKESAYDCCMACLDQARRARVGQRKCNIWVYCPSQTGCYSPDIYQHKYQECWLKYSETPQVNFKDTYSEAYQSAHRRAPVVVPWVSGVVG